jgi:hypothetical protein
VGVPRQHGNLTLVSTHRPELLSGFYIPQLDLASAETNTKVSTIIRKINRGDICALRRFTKVRDNPCIGSPDVRALSKGNSNNILDRP